MVVRLDLNQILTLKSRFNNCCFIIIYMFAQDSELIILISIDNVPTMYQNKYNENNRVNYLPTQFRYLENGVYRCESNGNVF